MPRSIVVIQSYNIHSTITKIDNKQQNKNLAPMLGKQRWNSRSTQPTPRASKSLAPEPSSLFTEPQEQNPLMRHLLHYQIQSSFNDSLMLANGHNII